MVGNRFLTYISSTSASTRIDILVDAQRSELRASWKRQYVSNRMVV